MFNKELVLKEAGEFLRKLRLETGKSVHKVAKEINISGNYLSEIERGVKEPSGVILDSLASYYNKDKNYIFSLYKKIPNEQEELIASNPYLRNLISKIAMDNRLSENERENLYKEFHKMYEKIISNTHNVGKE